MSNKEKYTLRLSLSILNHLGLNLYSNIPAVLSETVANGWDADASEVNIDILPEKERIEITDDGYGMTVDDINSKYLHVGYQKRVVEGSTTPEGRPIMGRKGIGKLSLFSIAEVIEIHSVKDGQKNGLVLCNKKIQQEIKEHKGVYHPDDVPKGNINIEKGTKIILTELKRNASKTDIFLRRRIARRFSIISEEYNFMVKVNGDPIGVQDRDFFNHIQFLWTIGKNSDKYKSNCRNAKKTRHFDGVVDSQRGYEISGWIGAVEKHGQLKEGNNKITILARGKLVQEDILEDFAEGGLYSKYLIGEINVDFVDLDDQPDITTSNRQRLIEDNERYQLLRKKILEILKEIQSVWTEWRKEFATKKALGNPTIKKWYESLGSVKKRKYAETIFNKIESIPVQNEEDKKELYKYGILAFERLRVRDNLEALDKLDKFSDMEFAPIFNDLEDIEAILYYDIASNRVKIIEAFAAIVDSNEKEKVIQKYIFDNLWLLHPSWERPTTNARMEEIVRKEFDKIDAQLKPEEKAARYDIKYRTAAGKHIIIELKRADRRIDVIPLVTQIKKYKDALRKCLSASGRGNEPIEIICLLGKPLEGEQDFITKQLDSVNARVIYYEQLIQDSLESYKDYLEQKSTVTNLKKIIDSL